VPVSPPISHPARLRFDEFELDEANARLLRSGKVVALAPTPFSVLCALARHPGALMTKETLLDTVWGHQFLSESALKTAVSDLRVALGDNAREPRFIETVSRKGYRFIATEPSQPSAVVSDPERMAPVSLPSSPSFVGRGDAVNRLQRAWQLACGGQRAMFWIAGEPGIGKTSVIEHFIAGLSGAARARGQCVEHYGAGEPYLPVLEALADLCRNDPTLPALLRSVAPTWLLQLPWLGSAEEREGLRRELAGIGPERMLREMGELLDRYTEKRPLLLVTEDLHWSDRATIQLIDHVARRRGSARLMWLATFRVAEVVARDHPLNSVRRELRMHRLCEEMVLDAFSEAEVADYVARQAPALAHNESFVRALHERTDGVPLFVSSVISEVLDRGGDAAAAEAWLAEAGVPENLAAIIEHYIARLGDDQRTLLAAAAVCGVNFRVATVAQALGLDVTSVAVACDQLVREHVWLAPAQAAGGDAPDLGYSFRHALFRQVLYDRTPPAVRAQRHREVGVALERERENGATIAASELAMHFDRGRQPLLAVRHYVEAAESALLHFSPSTCLVFTERALALLRQVPESPERDALEISSTTLQGVSAFHALGVGTEAKEAFERAYALLPKVPGHPVRGRLLHGFCYLLSLRGDYRRALEVAARAEALAADSNDPMLMLAACFVHSHVHHLSGRSQAARTAIERGLEIAAPLGIAANDVFAADPQVTLLCMLAIELVRSGLIEQGRNCLGGAQARARELHQPMTRLVAIWHEALLEVRLRNPERVAALADDMERLVDEFSLGEGRTACQWFRGWAQAHRGYPAEGYRAIRSAYEQNARLGLRVGGSEVLGYAAEALLLAGDLEAADVQLREAIDVAEELAERVYLPQLLITQATIARNKGRLADGAVAARQAVDEARMQDAPWLELLALIELCAHFAASGEEWRALATLVDRLPEAAQTPPVGRARAMLSARAQG
jgi:DNA-binding winged helix-turn-helix (wHTH) protein/tetratricopeptide (TPR) repeat protein